MNSRAVPVMLLVAAAILAVSPFLIDQAPPEATMGLVQKIFYVHLPSAILFLVAALICGGASGVFLFGRSPAADRAAIAAAELAIVFGLITLVTGPLWGRKAWGVWWAWEPRLTSTLVMWLLFGAFTLVRRFGGPGSELLSSGVGLFGMALVPFVYWSVNFWRTLHPKTTVLPTLPVSMGLPLWISFVGFAFLFAALMALRMRIERLRAAVDAAYAEAEES
jgi:heme exporter protein C